MSISTRRLLLLSGSALVALCLTGAASSQTPPTPSETPPTTTPPASEAPAPQPSQTTPEAPQTTPAPPQIAPETEPSIAVPAVTVTAPSRPRVRTARPAAPARVTTLPPPATTPTPTAAPGANTAGQPAATSPFNQPAASLTTITSNQIQASPAQSFGNLFFTLPGATSAGLAPGASRPVLRGLDDFRVRVQENGIGSMDVSDLGQDHGVPIDPLSIQKIEIYRGPEALRYGSQAVGGVVEATNNRIPFAAPVGGWQTQLRAPPPRSTAVSKAAPSSMPARATSPCTPTSTAATPATISFRATPIFSRPTRRRPSTASSRTPVCIPRDRRWAAPTCSTAAMWAPRSRAPPASIGFPPSTARQTGTRIDLQQTKITSKGEFRPQSSAIDVVQFWLGAVEYHHDELGLDDTGLDVARATFNNHAQEAKAEVKFMPVTTPFGTLISSIGTQFDHQQIDTAGDAGSLLGSARTNRGAAYFYNEFWLTDTLRTLLAGRIETVRLDGTAGIFPSALVPPPDNPDLLLQSLGFMPKSISFSVVKDLPSWMIASATVQRIERAPTALELFAHGAHDAPGTFEIGNPGLKIETANTAELGLKRIGRCVPLRRQGLLHQVRQFHLPASDRHSVRR